MRKRPADPQVASAVKNQVFLLHGEWRVAFGGRVLTPTWPERGPADTCLALLESGQGTVTPSGGVSWSKKPLPPDPEEMNDTRAEWAAVALAAFRTETGCEPDWALKDLLCDLMHWCDRQYDFNFEATLEAARRCYHEEIFLWKPVA